MYRKTVSRYTSSCLLLFPPRSTGSFYLYIIYYVIKARRRANNKGFAAGLIYACRGGSDGGMVLASENLKTKKTIPRTPDGRMDGRHNITSGQRDGGHILPSFRFNYGSLPYHMHIIHVYICAELF